MPQLRLRHTAALRAAALLVAGALAALPTSLRAQTAAAEAPRFLFVEAHGDYTRLTTKDADPQTGPGIGGEVGVMINRWFGVFAGLDVARLKINTDDVADGAEGLDVGLSDHTSLRHIEGGVRLRLPLASRATPYGEIGYSARRLHYKSDFDLTDAGIAESGTIEIETTGDAPLLGLGLEAGLSSAVSFDVGARYTFGKFDSATIRINGESAGGLDNSADQPKVSALRLRVGLRWYPALGTTRR